MVEHVPPTDALQFSRLGSTPSKTGILRDASNGNEDIDAEYAKFKAQLVAQKFAKLSKIGYRVGCGTVDLLRMLSVEGTSSNVKFFETRKLLSESINSFPSIYLSPQ